MTSFASMPETTVFLILLGVITVCCLAMTVTLAWTAWDVRGTLREARRSLRYARRLIVRADRVSRDVERLAHRACEIAASALERMARWPGRARGFFSGEHVGNGAGAEPGRHHRSR